MATAAKTAPKAPTPPTDNELMDDGGAFSGSDNEGEGNEGTPPAKSAKKSAAPARVKVKVGEHELETDEATAAALNSLMQTNAQMLAQIQAGYRAPSGSQEPPKKTDDYDYETGLFTEPAVALKRLREEMKAEIKAEMTGAYTAAESKKEFWNGFYKANEDLAENKLIVDAIVQRDWNKLSAMPVEDAAKAISKAAKAEIMRLSGGKKGDDGDQNNLEGSTSKNPPPKSQNDLKPEVTSMSAFIRQRQEAKRKAQFHKE